jgi:hypothetical protein
VKKEAKETGFPLKAMFEQIQILEARLGSLSLFLLGNFQVSSVCIPVLVTSTKEKVAS